MASGPITSWQVDGETVETVADFIFWGSRITADGDCSHEIKRPLLLKSYDQPRQNIKKVGAGIGVGNTCKSMADSCQCMTKTNTIL